MPMTSPLPALLALTAVVAVVGVAAKPQFVQRIGFGSCTNFDYGDLLAPIIDNGIIPAAPDAWIWNGDLAYLDSPGIDCGNPANVGTPGCACAPDYLVHQPFQCLAANVPNAMYKMQAQLDTPSFDRLLEFMCPGYKLRPGDRFPPLGRLPAVCPRQIFGTWDDHDYGWNNGDRRHPTKDQFKQIFLDAIGEAPNSPRRALTRGIYDRATLNANKPAQAIDLVLLDERWDRAPISCNQMRASCADDLVSTRTDSGTLTRQALCRDWFGNETSVYQGSCCKRDEDIYFGWCQDPANAADPRFTSACDPTNVAEYGRWNGERVNWAINKTDGSLRVAVEDFWRDGQEPSGFCEVLGPKQREWLSESQAQMRAKVSVYVSGSVLLGSPDTQYFKVNCSQDDWDCFTPAQVNFLHQIADGEGCPIVLSGDYHFGDVRMVDPLNKDAVYNTYYKTATLKKPVYQLMSSGMSKSTANGLISGGFVNGVRCNGRPEDTGVCCSFQIDSAGLRVPGLEPAGTCGAYGYSNFGLLDFDWAANTVTMKVMTENNTVATTGANVSAGGVPVPLEVTIDLDTCYPTMVGGKPYVQPGSA